MKTRDKEEIRKAVRDSYGKIARLGMKASGLIPALSCCGEKGILDTKRSPASYCGSPEFTPEKMSKSMSKDIFPTEAWELISKNREGDDLVIIDVSTPQEYKDLHLEGAINMNLISRFFKTRLDAMDKSSTYVVYCKVGGRSKIAQKLMHQLGFRTVYNVVGGTLMWEEEGLPFASGTEGVNKFSFCPFFISIVTFKKIKKILHNVSSRINQNTGIAASSGQES